MKRTITALLAAVLLLGFAACTEQRETEEEESLPGEPVQVEGVLGETLKTAFFSFCVEDFSRTGDAVGGVNPPEGMEFVVVSLSVSVPTGKPVIYYDDFDLVIDGEPRFPEPPWAGSHLPEEARLTNQLAGELVYTIPRGAKTLELVYDEYYQGDARGNSYRIPLE